MEYGSNSIASNSGISSAAVLFGCCLTGAAVASVDHSQVTCWDSIHEFLLLKAKLGIYSLPICNTSFKRWASFESSRAGLILDACGAFRDQCFAFDSTKICSSSSCASPHPFSDIVMQRFFLVMMLKWANNQSFVHHSERKKQICELVLIQPAHREIMFTEKITVEWHQTFRKITSAND